MFLFPCHWLCNTDEILFLWGKANRIASHATPALCSEVPGPWESLVSQNSSCNTRSPSLSGGRKPGFPNSERKRSTQQIDLRQGTVYSLKNCWPEILHTLNSAFLSANRTLGFSPSCTYLHGRSERVKDLIICIPSWILST